VGDAQPSSGILHWNGTEWSDVDNAVKTTLNGVWGSGPNDVWAVANFSSDAGIFHWDGKKWSSDPIKVGVQLSSVWGSGPDDVWAIGMDGIILRR
jgi:hypothetical protein